MRLLRLIPIFYYYFSFSGKEEKRKQSANFPAVGSLLTIFTEQLEVRFPKMGLGTPFINFASFLHPCFKGDSLEEITKSKDTLKVQIQLMVDNHASTQEFYDAMETERSSMDESVLDNPDLTVGERHFLQKKLTEVRAPTYTVDSIPPLQKEINEYVSMKHAPIKVDVLQWWKEHESKLPLLAKIARSYFCIPVTSASSERMFSVGGNICTDKR